VQGGAVISRYLAPVHACCKWLSDGRKHANNFQKPGKGGEISVGGCGFLCRRCEESNSSGQPTLIGLSNNAATISFLHAHE